MILTRLISCSVQLLLRQCFLSLWSVYFLQLVRNLVVYMYSVVAPCLSDAIFERIIGMRNFAHQLQRRCVVVDSSSKCGRLLLLPASTMYVGLGVFIFQYIMTRKPIQQPNRLTKIFGQMKETCPENIRLYATCVMMNQKAGTLDRGSCEVEFAGVKSCFRTVRRLR
jgi:hypothetical protein